MKKMRGILVAILGLVPLAVASAAFAGDRDAIVTSCQTRLNAPTRTCACMADKAIAEFSPHELAFFEMIMAHGVAGAMMAAPAGITHDEMTRVASRVQVMPAECVNG